MILGDGMIGQMMEPVEFPEAVDIEDLPEKKWATDGAEGRKRNIINSLYLDNDELESLNWKLKGKYEQMQKEDVKYETYNIEDAELMLIAYGTTARIALSAIDKARKNNIKVGMIRPITLFPFPENIISETSKNVEKILTLELSTGQMIEDVKLAVNGKRKVDFQGWPGGNIPTPDDIYQEIVKLTEMEG